MDTVDRSVRSYRSVHCHFTRVLPFYCIRNIPKKMIGLEDFHQMYSLLLNELDESFFAGRFHRASEGEQKILIKMAKIGRKVQISELRIKTGKDKNYLNQLLKSLIEKGLIY